MSLAPTASSELRSWVSDHVNTALSDCLASHRSVLAAHADELGQFVDALEQFCQGGKFLRPQFVAVGALMATDNALTIFADTLPRLGAAVELVQAAALIHDDLIDHSDTRRGRPSVHCAAEAFHKEANLAGSAEDFGAATAVVLGDLALTIAEQLASTALSSHTDREQFNLLRTEVMAGQYLDVLNQAQGLRSPGSAAASATAVTRWKTVPYTVQRPLLIGATHAGAHQKVIDVLHELSVPLGTAFQLRDDLLGVFGDERETGKPASGDITEGKRTVLLAYAEERATDTERAQLRAAVGNPGAHDDAIARAREIFDSTGARALVESQIAELADDTRAILDERLAPLVPEQSVAVLDELMTKATGVARAD